MKKILTNKLNILLVLLLTCIAILCGCKTNNTSNTPKNKNVEVGVWWWDNRIDANTYLNFAKENSVTEIYYYTSSFNEKTSNFIALANSLNIKVFLLGGKKEFLTNPQLAHTLVQKYLTYQQNNPQAKFCGIQFDIEPHQFSNFEENREKYNKYKVNKDEKEPKTAIWWAIMLFCIVYGIQVVYNNILLNGGL